MGGHGRTLYRIAHFENKFDGPPPPFGDVTFSLNWTPFFQKSTKKTSYQGHTDFLIMALEIPKTPKKGSKGAPPYPPLGSSRGRSRRDFWHFLRNLLYKHHVREKKTSKNAKKALYYRFFTIFDPLFEKLAKMGFLGSFLSDRIEPTCMPRLYRGRVFQPFTSFLPPPLPLDFTNPPFRNFGNPHFVILEIPIS